MRYLSAEEGEQLLATCQESRDRRLFGLVLLTLSTGARQGELLSLRWPQVDLQRGFAELRHTKNGDRRALALAGRALAVLAELSRVRRLDTDLVFADARGEATFPESAWRKVVRGAGVSNFRFHDLRHSCASYLAMNGATAPEIAAVLGHKTLAMVKRYSHLSQEHVLSVVARMNEKVLG